jgi:hypothetical protein
MRNVWTSSRYFEEYYFKIKYYPKINEFNNPIG